MMTKIANWFLRFTKWKYNNMPSDIDKAVVLMAPHTSILDFIYGRIYFSAQNKKPTILIKKEMFFFPLGFILKKLGGVPVDRGRRTGVAYRAVESFKENKQVYLVITPEGTRKKTKNWKRGFIKIAKTADVPVLISFVDCKKRELGIKGILDMSGTDEEIMERLKRNYIGLEGFRKNKFITGYE